MAMRRVRLWPGMLSASPKSSPPRVTPSTLRSFFTSSPPSARSRLPRGPLLQYTHLIFRFNRSILARRFHSLRSLRSKSDKATPSKTPDPTSQLGSPEPQPLSLSQRLKKLSREYGWSAFGVYMALTALDFPFCFIAVRALGTERIGHYEHVVIDTFKNLFGLAKSEEGEALAADGGAVQARESWQEDIDQAEADNQGAGASLWTQLALAYAIHKSFIFIRVPLTAAITPKVVKTLRGWGWNIGKRKPKAPKTPKTPEPPKSS